MTSAAGPDMSSTDQASTALILDVDGVVSPIKGPTAWGDDVQAGWAFGPVPVSPTLVARLDTIAHTAGLTCWWLTSWSPAMRAGASPFPGRGWPDIPHLNDDPTAEGDEWWKWTDLNKWLDGHPEIRRLVWCDDDLADPSHDPDDDPLRIQYGGENRDIGRDDPDRPDDDRPDAIASAYARGLAERNVDALLIAPATGTGLTPRHVEEIDRFLAS